LFDLVKWINEKGGGIMAHNGEYTVTVLEPHLDWGEDRNPTNRIPIPGESYVKIPSAEARRLDIRRGDRFLAYFENGMGPMEIKAAGNGPCDGNIQYAFWKRRKTKSLCW